MATSEELRWFWHLAGELEFAGLPPERRSLHRGVSWGTAHCAKDLLRDKGSEFRRKPPEPFFPELITFLRRLRWAVLFELAAHQERASSTAERAELRVLIFDEAAAAYPSTPGDLEHARDLFDYLGSAGHGDPDPELDNATENLLRSGSETFWAGGLVYDWLAEGQGFEAARAAEGGSFNLPNTVMLGALEAGAARPEICDGLAGFDDECFARAMESGHGNFAVLCLTNFEGLEGKEIAALNVEDLRVDEFGALLRVQRKTRGLLGSRRAEPMEQRITPFTRIALEQTLEGRTDGPLLSLSGGGRLTESLVNAVYLQAMAPSYPGSVTISGDEFRF